jgi:predicted P-loop ATPase
VTSVAWHAGPGEYADGAGNNAADAAAAHARGENVYGLPGLKEFFGDAAGKRVAKILGYNEAPAVMLPAAAAGLAWRERVKGGVPKATMHNARIAIQALNIACSYDTFHNKVLFGYADDDVRHELQSVIGDDLNHGLLRLRQMISDRFGFDPDDKPTSDAVVSLAMEHRFDPIADYLERVQGEWDGTKRLDTMAIVYFNAEDTPFNRAIVRKTMVAAVRRVLQPGCKFDTIIVLESPEGWNKSTAFEALAGNENFSDQSIIGANSREVQEQLAGIWIHENGELAGMPTRDVNAVKAYASRTVDIARPAFGRHPVKQQRRSIDVGTTNDDRYLLSQTQPALLADEDQ